MKKNTFTPKEVKKLLNKWCEEEGLNLMQACNLCLVKAKVLYQKEIRPGVLYRLSLLVPSLSLDETSTAEYLQSSGYTLTKDTIKAAQILIDNFQRTRSFPPEEQLYNLSYRRGNPLATVVENILSAVSQDSHKVLTNTYALLRTSLNFNETEIAAFKLEHNDSIKALASVINIWTDDNPKALYQQLQNSKNLLQ